MCKHCTPSWMKIAFFISLSAGERIVAALSGHLCGPESLSVGRSAGTAAPLCALLCLFKYSRQCCWSAWECRAHGAAALPLRRVKQPSSNRTGDRNDKSTHRMRSLFDPNRWLEPPGRRPDCFRGAHPLVRPLTLLPLSPRTESWKRVAVHLHYSRLLSSTERLYGLMGLTN